MVKVRRPTKDDITHIYTINEFSPDPDQLGSQK